MSVITIPKELIKNDDLVIISRKEYGEFLDFRIKKMEELKMTPVQKRALSRARKNLAEGKSLTLNELKQKLGIKN